MTQELKTKILSSLIYEKVINDRYKDACEATWNMITDYGDAIPEPYVNWEEFDVAFTKFTNLMEPHVMQQYNLIRHIIENEPENIIKSHNL